MSGEKARTLLTRMVWVLCGAVCAFAIENVWIDPWVVRRSHHRLSSLGLPSLVPQALGGIWSLVLMGMVMALMFALVCQILLVRNHRPPGWQKGLTGMAVMAAMALTAEWVVATGGITLPRHTRQEEKKHSVVLSWNASTTNNVRYNVYRGTAAGVHPDKLNNEPVEGLSFPDTTVESGKDYYYVARAVDLRGRESSDSNEVKVKIP